VVIFSDDKYRENSLLEIIVMFAGPVMVGLQTADDMIETMQYFYEKFQVQTSINVYHTYLRPGSPDSELQRFIPDPEEVAKVYREYKKMIGAVTLPMNCVNKDANLPEDCRRCKLGDHCWGCRSRSYAAGLGMYGKDPRCFRKRPSA